MPALGNSLTNRNAATVLRDGLSRVTQGEVTVDCSALQQVDSAAVAVLLAWQRVASRRGQTLALSGVPAQLRSLASLYGVDGLLGLASAADHADHHHRH
ncbi:phospholipid transport system transporter-binding protein [Cupriavidus metallidurans]|jgi:phospholipid transport system transporter-binding protein|uniref:Sulfate transporter/antisigma-factor antagonist STAS n=2 Tax=Cupriavidus metallidurans TaxID=119219 RepID=Q1LIA0_CUPMC|nr:MULTISPECIES: STAS domain-containing protein [Cupriavidus]PCH58279.1 MAG: STAS domain-containing protein [Burkholderiaceae bacterium]HBD35778.1 STAS domain-containing protein [Cupriavidus sp.]ABF10126.1 Sulfate transporter/antisigma-factor antagonist STAS [Cupriavidus metallidurans CH34]AVA37226.1 STAS domain-containing protein [Cupriavidus metallidurans]ELA00294.1 Sulfate transporter/antisigma-factor antagonist STAS [Cupriavidus sp. HMR-1]